MATLTHRERLEQAISNMKSFADELDSRDAAPSGDELARLTAMGADVQNAQKAFEGRNSASAQLSSAQRFISDLAHAPEDAVKSFKDVERTDDGRLANPMGLTLGQLFTDSQQFKDFGSKYKGIDGLIADRTKGISSAPFNTSSGVKTLITGASATSAGAAVRNDLYAPIADRDPFHELSLMDLITKGTTGSDTVEYVSLTSKTNAAAAVAEATSSADGAKPESAIAMAVQSVGVVTLAHWIPITKRAASDAGQVRTMVDEFLQAGLKDKIEAEALAGSGGTSFTGILNTGSILTVGSAGTDLDAVVDAISAIRVTGRNKPTALMVHPSDWYSTGFLTAKDSAGKYLIADPAMGVGQNSSLWGMQVVVSESVTQNTALVGDFRKAVYWEREPITVVMTDSHSDFFIRNILVILAETRAAFAVLDPQAFCTITAV